MPRRKFRRGPSCRVRIAEPFERFEADNGALSPRRWHPGMVCSICGSPVRQWQNFNQDHVVPMALGGAKGKRNKSFAHELCNAVKGSKYPFSLRTPEERAAIQASVKRVTYERLLRVWAGQAL